MVKTIIFIFLSFIIFILINILIFKLLIIYVFYVIFTLTEPLLFISNINILNIMYLFIECLFKSIFYIYISEAIILIDLISI